jgi:hypothetical protein
VLSGNASITDGGCSAAAAPWHHYGRVHAPKATVQPLLSNITPPLRGITLPVVIDLIAYGDFPNFEDAFSATSRRHSLLDFHHAG